MESFGALKLEYSILKQQFLAGHRKQLPSIILRVKLATSSQIILPCINVCTELPAENRFRLG